MSKSNRPFYTYHHLDTSHSPFLNVHQCVYVLIGCLHIQWLGQCIRVLFFGLHVGDVDLSLLYGVSNHMVLHIDVTGPLAKWVAG